MFTHPAKCSTYADAALLLSATRYGIVPPFAVTALTAKPLGGELRVGDYDVVCGRGKGSYNKVGNKRFRQLVSTYIPAYLEARNKYEKSNILQEIIDKITDQVDPVQGRRAAFVKFSKSTGWTELSDNLAREKVGHAMREAIATKEGRKAKSVKTKQSTAKPEPKISPTAKLIKPSLPTSGESSVNPPPLPPILRRMSTQTVLAAIRRTSGLLAGDIAAAVTEV